MSDPEVVFWWRHPQLACLVLLLALMLVIGLVTAALHWVDDCLREYERRHDRWGRG